MTGQDALSPSEVAFLVETRGVAKATAPVVTTFVLGVVAGAFIALGGVLGGALLVGLVYWFVYVRPTRTA